MTDEELIEAGRAHVKVIQRAQLEIGRLALAYAPIGDVSVKTGVYDRLQEYADAIGIDLGTLRNYRAVASAWEGHMVDGLGFTTLKGLTPVAKKAKLLERLREVEPPTRSGRWTEQAAVEFARREGLWSGEELRLRDIERGPDGDVLAYVRRARGGLARIADVDVASLSEERRRDLVLAINEFSHDLSTLRERLQGIRVGR